MANSNLLYSDSTQPLLINSDAEVEVAIHYPYTEVKIYKRRWIILSAFAMLGFIQGAIWNTWGPISSTSKIVFPHWNDATIALLSNWGNICYVIFLFPVIWIMDTKGKKVCFHWNTFFFALIRFLMSCTLGIRNSTLLAAILIFIGAGIRCFTMNSYAETWFVAQFRLHTIFLFSSWEGVLPMHYCTVTI